VNGRKSVCLDGLNCNQISLVIVSVVFFQNLFLFDDLLWNLFLHFVLGLYLTLFINSSSHEFQEVFTDFVVILLSLVFKRLYIQFIIIILLFRNVSLFLPLSVWGNGLNWVLFALSFLEKARCTSHVFCDGMVQIFRRLVLLFYILFRNQLCLVCLGKIVNWNRNWFEILLIRNNAVVSSLIWVGEVADERRKAHWICHSNHVGSCLFIYFE